MKIEVHGDNEVMLSIEKYTSTEKLIGAVQSACAVVEEAARKKKLRAKKAKKVSFYTILSSVLVTGILLLTFLFLIPSSLL